MLVAGGASLLQLDNHGNTAKTLALQANDYQLAAYLESTFSSFNETYFSESSITPTAQAFWLIYH